MLQALHVVKQELEVFCVATASARPLGRRMKSYTLFTMRQKGANHEYEAEARKHSRAQIDYGSGAILGSSPHELQKHASG